MAKKIRGNAKPRSGKRTYHVSPAVQDLVDYILEHEQEDYQTWCDAEGYGIDSKEAMNKHIYGTACKVLGRKPSYFIQEVEHAS